MMKQLVFSYEGYDVTNIGDYVQSLAALQFSGNENEVILWHRDDLKSYEGEEVFCLMNGWFTHRPENWPPSERIKPLFIATHFNSQVYPNILSQDSIAYLKKHEPIGCRDIATAKKLEEKGVQAYFSSCLTTTLGMKYKKSASTKRHGIYIVDPVHYIPESSGRLRKYLFIFNYLRNKKGVDRYIKSLLANNPYNISWNTKRMDIIRQATRSYIVVTKIIGKANIKDAIVITQSHDQRDIPSQTERFERARSLIRKYSEAELVITSRIHCALPCLGLETPVIFLQNCDDSLESTCRFEGLLNLLHVIKFRKDKIFESQLPLPIKLNSFVNKEDFRTYAQAIMKKCIGFVNRMKSEI